MNIFIIIISLFKLTLFYALQSYRLGFGGNFRKTIIIGNDESVSELKEFFINQLDELLDKLDLNKKKFELVGYSMGGCIASAYAARNPDRLKKLTLLASAGIMHNLGFLAKAAKFPIFGRFLFLLFYGLLHKRSTEKERMLTSSVPNIVERQQNELNFKGFLPSVLASIKGILSSNSYEDHMALKDVNFPILAILSLIHI